MKTIVVLFDDLRNAERAVRAVLDEAETPVSLSLVAAAECDEGAVADEQSYMSGVFRARSGAALELARMLPDLTVVSIPGVGSVLASGPLSMARATEATPVSHGGLHGDLVTAGVADDDARRYVEGVRRGGAIVMVVAAQRRVERLAELLAACKPIDLDQHARLVP